MPPDACSKLETAVKSTGITAELKKRRQPPACDSGSLGRAEQDLPEQVGLLRQSSGRKVLSGKTRYFFGFTLKW